MTATYKYYLFNKPYGVLSQFTREVSTHRTLADYLTLPSDVYPVGRLDKDTEGLLVLTNDNKLKTNLLDPDKHTTKTYIAQVEGQIISAALQALQLGVDIKVGKKRYTTRPAEACALASYSMPDRDPPVRYRASIPTTWIELKITEGKNRQVRKMCAAVGHPVLRLIRTAIGQLNVDIAAGAVIELSPQQIQQLVGK